MLSFFDPLPDTSMSFETRKAVRAEEIREERAAEFDRIVDYRNYPEPESTNLIRHRKG